MMISGKTLAFLAIAAVAAMAVATTAHAGSGKLTHASGKSVYVKCKNSGCTSTYYDATGATVNTKKSKGGTANYVKLVAALKAKGYR